MRIKCIKCGELKNNIITHGEWKDCCEDCFNSFVDSKLIRYDNF